MELVDLSLLEVSNDSTVKIAYENTNSSFDCFSECIRDFACKNVARYHPSIRNGFNDCVHASNMNDFEVVQDAQYAQILGLF